ncbi:hypothetical protein GCM10011343_20960 [Flavobacterium orientale]|uniref:DKNYY family protein n=2 Tax=Flavobacterium orientale TaxID=1756020 RepID=A0A917DEL6_9FLAO|nr:hypothetical protein GCM10011343_20960 [Flavobacterium orientale]
MLLSVLVSFSQNDTLSSFDVKKVLNVDEQKYYYYEKLNSKEDTFNPDNYILIDNKVIKSKNKLEIIKNGFLEKEIIFTTADSKKIIHIVEDTPIFYKIYCDENGLKKVEVFKDTILIKEFFYGLNHRVYSYSYTDFGYFLLDHFNGKIYKYKVVVTTSKIVKKELVETSDASEIAEDSDGAYFYTNTVSESDVIFDRFTKECSKE